MKGTHQVFINLHYQAGFSFPRYGKLFFFLEQEEHTFFLITSEPFWLGFSQVVIVNLGADSNFCRKLYHINPLKHVGFASFTLNITF